MFHFHFNTVFIPGGLGSLGASSVAHAMAEVKNKVIVAAGMMGSSALMSVVSSKLSGGSFWDGMRNSLISATLNHAAHMVTVGVEVGVEQNESEESSSNNNTTSSESSSNSDDGVTYIPPEKFESTMDQNADQFDDASKILGKIAYGGGIVDGVSAVASGKVNPATLLINVTIGGAAIELGLTSRQYSDLSSSYHTLDENSGVWAVTSTFKYHTTVTFYSAGSGARLGYVYFNVGSKGPLINKPGGP